ncbi:uncharacterized protein LOC111621581 [Centruroides sculpturatus]|uniref:uncharacterized protein LOC111621580 n=1 Tax=Centruroides sculpturatus TaxID=218467 RepID=UPI000C6E975C|nr:uncharacterized protein LOC111621580 [Centruroides sculpturatus]XP_023219530.1 uncharacterized protein LOC111621581 [Centruroides sculpturatus]
MLGMEPYKECNCEGSKMSPFTTYIYFNVTYCLIYVCCAFAFLLSLLTAAMQNGFQDIRRFAICHLELEQKLRILNFMKRFGKASLLFSAEDYFNVTKKFPIKMASSLHSIFSSLTNLRSVEQKTKCIEGDSEKIRNLFLN